MLCEYFFSQHTRRCLKWIPRIVTIAREQRQILRFCCRRISFCFFLVGMPFKWLLKINGVVLTLFRNRNNFLLIYSPCSLNPKVVNCFSIRFFSCSFHSFRHILLLNFLFCSNISPMSLLRDLSSKFSALVPIEELENLLYECMLLTFNTEIEDGSIEQVHLSTFIFYNFVLCKIREHCSSDIPQHFPRFSRS